MLLDLYKSMSKLSILIPARNEEFLTHTILDIVKHAETDIEILVGLDGYLTKIPYLPMVSWTYTEQPIGQRAMTNRLANMATGDYLMKLDAHCSMSQGFDKALLEDASEDVLLVPAICNLHAYNWVCENEHRHFQGKYDKCEQCDSTDLRKEIIWQPIAKPIRSNFYFDTSLHFQYMPEDVEGLLTETMSIQGSCFVVSKKKYFELNICDEAIGSWGQQGVETACKTWLSGGKVLCSKKAYYGHQFRETEGFPYDNKVEDIFKAQAFTKNLFLENKWDKQVHSFQWLIEKFNFPGDWTPEKLKELCKPWYNINN